MQKRYLYWIGLLISLVSAVEGFTFRELLVTAASYVTNVTTTYTISYQYYRTNTFANTAWNTTFLASTDKVTLTFPNQFTLGAVTCRYSINSTGVYTDNTCAVSGNVITLSSIFSSTIVNTFSLVVGNVVNPYPAGVTSHFYGTIGADTSNTTGTNSIATITTALSACSFTFDPNYVYTNPANMMISLTTVNQFPTSGSIKVQFPFTRKWSQDLSTTRFMPITDGSMSCSSQSANINTGIQCSGSQSSALVTVTNLISTTLAAASSLSFSINNFNSPPTNQPVDALTITTYSSSGAAIDQCSAYVTGLLPKVIDSSAFSIAESGGASMVVNKQYTITFSITIADIISSTDYVTIVFPTGTTITNFPGATMGGTLGINTATSTYSSQKLTVYFLGVTTIPAQSQIFITISNFIAPPSTLPTANFVFTFLNSGGYPKMVSYQTMTAVTGTLSGTPAPALTTVNTKTSYVFSITTTNALLPSGSFKIVFPSILLVDNSTTCAAVVGTGMASSPICAYNSIENSVTFTAINSSSSNIQGQSFSLTVSGVTNSPSIKPTGTFSMVTYYGTGGQVDAGTIPGVTASQATIDYTKAAVSASSRVNSATAVSYYLSFTIANPIPAGGYILAYFPTSVTFDLTAASSQCQIMLNSSTSVSTTCTATLGTSYVFNFTNPLSATAGATTNITLVISSAATNPGSTKPFSPFSVYTYHSDSYLIASMQNALTYNTITASAFGYNQVGRTSQVNAAFTTYTVTLAQEADLEVNAKIIVVFPSSAVPQTNSTCSMLYNSVTSTVICSLSGSTFTVTSIPSVISASSTFSISFTNIRNPYSFTTLSPIATTSKSANSLYLYSTGQTTNSLQTTTATAFKSITYTYSPRILNSAIDLFLSFQLSQYQLLPSYLLLSVDTYFNEGTLLCGSFINFIGACTVVSNNTVKITGSFNNSEMGVSLSGFSSTSTLPTGTTYTTLISFDSTDGMIDQSLNQIVFSLNCATPCKTCSASNTSACLSCYNDTAITTSVYFDTTLSSCYATCPDTTYNAATLTCQLCNSNCYTCLATATFCTKCKSTSSYPYLNITSVTVQTCVSACVAGMYPRTSSDPALCVTCVSPCATCTSQTACIACATGFFLDNVTCTSVCPAGTTIANNATNTCDPCNVICLTCSISTSNCTACSSPNVYYNGSCQSSCPAGGTLAPQNGICTACDSTCLYCSVTITNCTQCNIASTFPYFVSNKCLASCPEKYYNVSLTGQCLSCATAGINCLNCSSASTCLSCDTGFVFFSNQCLSYTPTGYVNISGIAVVCAGDCKTCEVAADNCTSCKTLNLESFKCVANCLSGYIPVSQVCTVCTSPCATCSGTVATCLTCLPTLSPLKYLTGTTCQATCPAYTYSNATTLKCQSCISPCSTCSSYTSCLSCVSPTYLSNTTCQSVCPSGYVGITGQCVACTNNCKTCLNATNVCLTCNTNTYFLSSTSSCVADCNPGLFIDYTNQICVGCTAPCSTCTNSTTLCTSCATGYLLNSKCQTSCPTGMYVLSGACTYCATNCSTCSSLTNCSICAGTSLLYNGACVLSCPTTAPVIYLSSCNPCSTQNCFSCSSADVCNTCKSTFLYLNAQCLIACPSNYTSNGTHCIELNTTIIDSVTTPTTFPVPFSIAGAVLVIACLMSRLQFSQTYLSGAVYSLMGVLQVLALCYFLYLYYKDYYSVETIPLWIGLGGLGYLYLLNLIATIAQSVFLCSSRQFSTWRCSSSLNSCFYYFISLCSLLLSHKTRNILFSKLFTFKIFSAKLDSVQHFRIFNVFSLLSLVHSGAAIFAAAVAMKYINQKEQVHYEAIDVIVVTSINVLLAFFNTHKDKDFFQEVTPEGFNLHKMNKIDQDHYPDKIKIEGHDGEIEEGFLNDYSHALQSKAALRFDQGSLNEIYSESLDYVSERQPQQESQSPKEYEEISIQAYDMLEEKANVTSKTVKTAVKPQYQSISIQADELIEPEKQDRGIDLSDLPAQGFQNQSSDFTKYNIFERVDVAAQSNFDRGVNHSAQISLNQVDMSVQKYEDGVAVDCSIQKSAVRNHDISVQNTLGDYRDASIQQSDRAQDVSVAMTGQAVSSKYVSMRPDLKSQQNQMTIQLQDQQIQMGVDQVDYGIQPQPIDRHEIGIQPTLEVDQVQPSLNSMGIQYQQGDEVAYDQFEEQLQNQHTPSNIVFDQSEQHYGEEAQKELAEEKAEKLQMRTENVRSYQQELEDRIRERENQLEEMRRKILLKEKINERKKEELGRIDNEEERVELGGIRYNEERPRVSSTVKPESTKNIGRIQTKSKAQQHIPLPPEQQLQLQSKQLGLNPNYPKGLIQPRREKTIQQINLANEDSREKTIQQIYLAKEGSVKMKQQINFAKAEPVKREKTGLQFNFAKAESIKREKTSSQMNSAKAQSVKREKTLQQIAVNNQIVVLPQGPTIESREQEQLFQSSKSRKIQYKEVDKSLESQQERSNIFVRSNLQQEKPPITSQQTQRPKVEYEGLSDIELKSETTQKKYRPNSPEYKNYDINVQEIDRSLDDDNDELQQNSQYQPTGIVNPYPYHPKHRERSPESDLSGTIEQIPKQYSKIDNDKTISASSVKPAKNQANSRAVAQPSSKINKQEVTNYYKGEISQTVLGGKNKPRDIPKDIDQDRFHINKLYPREIEREPLPGKGQTKNSTFAMAGRSQFSEDIAKRKDKEGKNPLDTKKNWQFKPEDKYVEDQEFRSIPAGNNRANLTRNKQLQNFASHLVLPQESDKQETSFQKAMHKQEKDDKPISEKRDVGYPRPRKEVEEIEVHFEADQFSRDLSSRGRNEMPEPPRTGYPQKLPSQTSNSNYNDQPQENDLRGQMLMGQMQQRPNNDDLQDYYRRKNNSKQKRRRSNSKVDKSTEKIYMQKLQKKK